MSELRIALVAEGPTDQVIIKAVLKAILPMTFVLTLLQPEPTRPEMGGGWGGVFKWCREFGQQGYTVLEDDPKLGDFDLIIVHLDADVADKAYADCGEAVVEAAADLPGLPCSMPCPPPADTVQHMRDILLAWLGIDHLGGKTIFCIPSKAIEAWLAVALLPDNHVLLPEIECRMDLEKSLSQLPKTLRVRKRTVVYRRHASTVTNQWPRIHELCSQAVVFYENIAAVAPGREGGRS